MNFDFSITNNLQEAKQYLKAGIHKVKFDGITVEPIVKDGITSQVLTVTFSNEEGEFSQKYWEPTKNERTDNQFGGKNPSQLEQFACSIRQIIAALNPEADAKITNNEKKLESPTAKGLFDLIAKILKPSVNQLIEIKLIPNGQYANFPGFPAKISKDGKLYLATKFIGNNLTLSNSEKLLIERANTASPTDMSKTNIPKLQNSEADDLLNSTAKDFGEKEVDDDDLPF